MLDKLYKIVEDQYFKSNDFNGMPIYRLTDDFDVDSNEFREVIKNAIDQEILTVTFFGNTHILALSGYPKEKIMEWFNTEDYPSHICLYPHANQLKKSIQLESLKDSPYELELAKGAGQLDYRTFDLSVLEYYRNDPRYSYETDFIRGAIRIKDEYFESKSVPEHDQILLSTFGFGYDDDLNRYVVVFLRYLKGLSSEHQKVWSVKEVKGHIMPHPDYYNSCIKGDWGTKISIFEAFVQELKIINEMSLTIGKPILFRNDYYSKRPKEFGFLLRPTESEFNNFILLLDKMMSDNINKKFFNGDVDIETDIERADGKIIVTQKGTIQILESWVNKYFTPRDRTSVDEMLATFREVRSLRQKPAHKVNTDSFNQNIFRKQREIIIKAYDAVRTLRLILANHPAVKKSPPQISKYLYEGKIWDI
ncbi:MAG: hypothetical protein KAS17_13100 [Victivallaceae bacterium]|nr:hypothetical protein [Victivallaceae bacterium]